MPELVTPSAQYKDSFVAALKEFHAEHLHNYEHVHEDWVANHFDEYIEQLLAEAKGERLPSGFVPHSILWLVEGNEFLGQVDIRHELNHFLRTVGGHIGYNIRPSQRRKGYGTLALKLGLEKARELGLTEVLVTCDVDNVGSNKIIQANGGIFTQQYPMPGGTPDKNHYLFKL